MARREATRLANGRRAVIGVLAGLAIVGGPVTIAHAGSYEVDACDAAGGANNSWFTGVTHGGMTAYSACPSGGDSNRGIVVRNAIQPSGWTVPYNAAARAVFFAPEGTAIVGVTAAYRFYREYGGYFVGLSNGPSN